MAKEIIRTPNAPSPPPTYSQAVRAAGLVFVSGTGPLDPASGKIVGDTIQEQTRKCLENVSAILNAAGSSLDRVLSATRIFFLKRTDFAGMNERIEIKTLWSEVPAAFRMADTFSRHFLVCSWIVYFTMFHSGGASRCLRRTPDPQPVLPGCKWAAETEHFKPCE